MKVLISSLLLMAISSTVLMQTGKRTPAGLPAGYWPVEKSQALLDKTQTIRLAPDLSHLTAGERRAVALLLEVGKLFQTIYEDQRHGQALEAYHKLVALDQRMGSPAATKNLLTLYRLAQGPIATTLENKREPFLPVDGPAPGANFYPWGIKKEEIDAYLTAHPDQRDSLMDLRTVVRRATAENLRRDLGKVRQYPVLDVLHPGLRTGWEQRAAHPDAKALYAVPYSIAWADQLVQSFKLLNQAADAVNADDEEFARYLRNRARDLLSDDYESGDAAWVTGRFKHLNACIGSYETYDDAIYGVKTSFAFSLLAVRPEETTALRAAMKGMQELENSL
ncbi:MAG: NUDIX hydrolase, partial [Pyrinomonadaceae bacterium]